MLNHATLVSLLRKSDYCYLTLCDSEYFTNEKGDESTIDHYYALKQPETQVDCFKHPILHIESIQATAILERWINARDVIVHLT